MKYFHATGYCRHCGRPLTEAAWAKLEAQLRAAAAGCGDVGRMVDELTREKMLSLRRPVEDWKRHYTERFERVE